MYGYGNFLPKIKAGASVPAAPANIVQPSLVGNGAVGSVVTCNPGAWSGSPSPTFSYDFRVNAVSVQSGASNTYTPLIGDDTKTLTCTVTATNTEGSASADTSNSLVIGTAPSNTVAPVISGTNTFGSTLTTTNGTFTGTTPLTYTYQWLRGGSPISGETATTYVIGASDSLAAITCEVKATNTYGFDSEVSNTITVQDFAPINTVAPTVSPSGTQSTGTLITANVGTWTGVAPITYEYKWTRNGVAISGATASTYTIQLADDGATIRVEVKGTNAYGVSAFIVSSNSVSAVNVIAPTNSVAPVISGTTIVGQVLTSTTGTWSGTAPITYSYQWKRGATNIGINASTYTLVQTDAGQSITCVVTATNAGGSANATSNALTILATLLDIYPNASTAYSFRLLMGAYYGSPAIRVRRSNDNVEQNIGFTSSGNLDTSALTTFVAGNNGFIVTWFDQSGNGNNVTQATPSQQPQIVISGTIVTQNTKTAIQNNSLLTARLINNTLTLGTTQSIFAIGNSPQTDRQVFFDSYNNSPNAFLRLVDPNVMSVQGSVSLVTTNSNQKIFSILAATDLNVWENNSLIITNTTNTVTGLSGLSLFDIRGNPTPLVTGYAWEGKMQEIVIYLASQSSNRIAIQNNINAHYATY